MNTSANTTTTSPSIKEKILDELKKALVLALYLGTWFCALAFLAATTLRESPIPLSIFGLSLVKAVVCAKFMLVAQSAYPMKFQRENGIIRPLLVLSLIHVGIVLVLSFNEAGIVGLFHGKGFWASLLSFGNGDPLHILSMSIVYWLIVLPYLLFASMRIAMGDLELRTLFLGPPKQTSK
ncbi:MAG: hypothetical protein ACOYK2_01300 [Polynucleobacter sp.]